VDGRKRNDDFNIILKKMKDLQNRKNNKPKKGIDLKIIIIR
jgi:hypothetical protein